jgi:8-oxo-dGTP pyrophosphatase MutT (NUDIX family)
MKGEPVPAVPASTVLAIRDGSDGLEVFMVVRHHEIDFASGALVFPGGKQAAGDAAPLVRPCCDGAEAFDDVELGLRVAAIREVFEECGLLLARPRGQGSLIGAAALLALDGFRGPLDRGEMGMAELAERAGITFACDLLVPFAHWITPLGMPKRFDTHFYLAVAPEDQVAVHDGSESVDSVWIPPAQAVAEGEAGRRTVIFPTRLNLTKLARSQTVDEAIRNARAARIVTVQPKMERTERGAVLRIPAEADYGLTDEVMERAAGR